ncbi:hypothetical protein Tco_0708669 [Tanacetum coccineum]
MHDICKEVDRSAHQLVESERRLFCLSNSADPGVAKDEKSRSVGIEVVVGPVVGMGFGVDCCGMGVNGVIFRGTVVAATVEDSRIAVTGIVDPT